MLIIRRDALMPKSLIADALGGGIDSTNTEQPNAGESGTPEPVVSADDKDLEKIVSQLDVSIKIIGCGGGGSNTINRLHACGIAGAQLFAMNTDVKHLLSINATRKILIGKRITKGLGAGALPEVGEAAARENENEIKDMLKDTNIVFLTAGMGGGTGTGASHYVAGLAKSAQALVISIVTLPFKAEGEVRMENALEGVERLRRICDTTIVIPNDKLIQLVPNLPINAAFKVADEVLMQTIKGLTEIITKPGLVNLDYADIKTVMNEGGVAFVGMGESDDKDCGDRVELAVNEALNSPLLGEIDITESKGCLIRVVGGPDMTVTQAQRAAEIVGSKIPHRSRLIWGCSVEPDLAGTIKILLIFTGSKSRLIASRGSQPIDERAVSGHGPGNDSFITSRQNIDMIS
jgi:cell division protein FtsZ